MFLGKKNHLVGLDIGSRTLKAAELVETARGFRLKNMGVIDIVPGLIEEGIIRKPEEVANSIHQLFKAYNIKEKNVAISIGGYSVIVKRITLQNMTEDQLQEVINLEAEQYIPFDISDVNIDFQILGENESNPNMMNVLLVAARREFVDDYISLVQMAELNPCVVDVDAFALQNIFEISYDTIDQSVALIDIGAQKTSISIMKNNSSVFTRDVSLGCGQINQQIVSLIDCSLEEAEEIKHSEETEKIPMGQLGNIISSVSQNWCVEIRRALDFYYSSYPNEEIKKIILSGGGANIEEFRNLLRKDASTEVEVFNPFKSFDIDEKIDLSYLEQIAPQSAICMGLAIRRVDDK